MESILPPTGLAYLAAVLEESGQSVRILDANALNSSSRDVLQTVEDYGPTIVGITSTTPTFGSAIGIANAVKEAHPEILVVMGGPHPTILPEETVNEPGVDLVVRGEGEYTLLEIMERYDGDVRKLRRVKGVVFRNPVTKKLVKTPPRPLIENLDKLPFPARHLLPMDKYRTAIAGNKFQLVLTSRGCPGRCMFCAKFVFGAKFRARSPENIIEEIEFLRKNYDVREIDFMDDAFTCDAERVERLCDAMVEQGIKIPWRCSGGTRVDMVGGRLLKKMKAAGCSQISYGVESGDDEVLRKIGKGVTTQDIREAFRKTREAGIETIAFFMLGLPFDTLETMEKTVQFAKELDPDYIQFTIATPLPGTAMYYWVKKHATKLLFTDWKDLNFFGKVSFETGNFTEEDVLRFYKRVHREFYLRPGYILKQLFHGGILNKTRKGLYALKSLWRLVR